MNMDFSKHPKETAPSHEAVKSESESESPALQDEELQAAYRKAYLEQLRRRACPGCGESDLF